MSAKDQIKQLVDYFKREPYLKDKTDAMGEGLMLGASLADDANERSKEATATTKAIQDKYKEQLLAQDLNPNKDPELVDLRNGNATAGERITKFEQETTAQFQQKTQKNIIDILALGAKPDDPSFDNGPIIQLAFDNYEIIIIDGNYHTSPLMTNKPVTIRGTSTLFAFGRQEYILKIKSLVIIENSVNLDGAYLSDIGCMVEGGNRSILNKISAIRNRIWGVCFSKTGNNNFVAINFLKTNVNGTKTAYGYTKTSPKTITLKTPITESKIKEFSYYFNFFEHSKEATGIMNSISTDGSVVTFKRDLPTDLPINGNVNGYAGGGIGVLANGNNNCLDFINVDCADNYGPGLECHAQHALNINSYTSQGNAYGISTYNYCLSITIAHAYFENSIVKDIVADIYNNLTILGQATILRGFGENNIDRYKNTNFVSELFKKTAVLTGNIPGARTLNNLDSGDTFIFNMTLVNHSITLDYVKGLSNDLYDRPMTIYYTPTGNNAGIVSFKKSVNSDVKIEGHNEINYTIGAGNSVKFEVVPFGTDANKVWKIFKTEYPATGYSVVS